MPYPYAQFAKMADLKPKRSEIFHEAHLRRYHVQCDSRFVRQNTYEKQPFANKS